MEFKRDPRDGVYYFIEPTIGRHDWNNAFGEGNGFPMPYMNYLDALEKPIPQYKQKRISRRWVRWSADYETAKEKMKQGDLSLGCWLRSIRPPVSGAIFAIDDPLPFFGKIYRKLFKIKKIAKKKVRKVILFEKYRILSKRADLVNKTEVGELFFRQATEHDALTIARQYGEHFGENAAQEIMQRLSGGEILIIGSFLSSFEDICYLAWLSRDDLFFNAANKFLNSKKSICLYRIYVPHAHRNKGIGEYALSYIETNFLAKDFEQILAFVHVGNYPSLAMFEKRDWSDLGILYRLRFFGKEITKVSLK
jgi:GNAT superfamily N-acetyltransferase